jgi:hypothetical protein
VLRRLIEPGQCTSHVFARRCREAGIVPSMGSVDEAYDCENSGRRSAA